MPHRRKLARYAAPVDAIRQQRVEEVAHILPPRLAQPALALQQKLGVLLQVRAISRDAQRRESLLDLEVVEKRDQQPQAGIGTLHDMSMKANSSGGNNERGTGRCQLSVVGCQLSVSRSRLPLSQPAPELALETSR